MTNVFSTPDKVINRDKLFKAGLMTLEKEGWEVSRIKGAGKSSVRRITKDGESKIASIRTTQNTWVAFPRNKSDTAWGTLEGADMVVAVSVDEKDSPRFAQVHFVEGSEMRRRFDRAYTARKAAGYKMPVGRGIWLSMYDLEAKSPVTLVGAGIGLDNPAVGRIPLSSIKAGERDGAEEGDDAEEAEGSGHADEVPLTIAEAKRRLAMTFGVDPSAIKIIVEG